MRERRADEASRDVVAFLKCEFMRDRLGQTFAGVVTGVTDFGLFVQLEGLQVDGLVHVATLGRDYFRYEEDRKALVGERSGERYTLGDKLTVKVTRVDPSERKIDFELVGKTAEAYHPRRGEPAAAARPEGAARGKPAKKGGARAPKGANGGGRGRSKGGRGR